MRAFILLLSWFNRDFHLEHACLFNPRTLRVAYHSSFTRQLRDRASIIIYTSFIRRASLSGGSRAYVFEIIARRKIRINAMIRLLILRWLILAYFDDNNPSVHFTFFPG